METLMRVLRYLKLTPGKGILFNKKARVKVIVPFVGEIC